MLFLIAGFPVALIFSWAFEITPEGIKRESEIEARQIDRPSHWTKNCRDYDRPRSDRGWLACVPAFPCKIDNCASKRRRARRTQFRTKAIAVLPFDNLSDDKSNAYFAEGIQDEILTRLSKIAALKVISRTSTQKYKSAPDNLRDVGKQLGVANMLEGSVQKIANAVHVNVQLIRVATDEHLWAESYNRKLDDVFGVEGEVASAIADQLNAKLTGAEQKAVTR